MVRQRGAEPIVSLGWQIVDFIEALLVHGPGDVEGDPIEIDDDFAAAVVRMYQLHPRTGRRKVRRYTLSRAKGRSKSELAGMLCIVEALGPCRFSHWAAPGEVSWWGYRYEAGEPVGCPVRSPFIRVLATEENQTGNTYAVVVAMLRSGRIAELVPRLDVGDTRTFVYGPDGGAPRGEIRPQSAGAASKDGGRESFVVADEIHLYTTPGLHRLYETCDRNARKRKVAQPWVLNTTTAWLVGEMSVAEQLADETQSESVVFDHVQGVGRAEDLRLGDLRGPRQPEWKTLKDALSVAYGPAAVWMDLDAIITEEFARKRKDKALSARYFLNIPQVSGASTGWLRDTPEAWIACRDTDLAPLPGETTWCGVDGSLNRDSTSVAWVQWAGNRLVVRQKAWRPKDHGGRIPYDEVREFLRSLCAAFTVRSVAYDTRFFSESALELQDEGLPMLEVPQSVERMTPICGRAAEAVLGGEIAHDGDPDLWAAVHGAAKKPNERGFTFSKVKSGQLIDPWVAVCLAISEAVRVSDPVDAVQMW